MQSPPLAELYDLLRADGLAIGVDDHIRIGRLLARDAAWTLETLRISIAALVVTDPHERAAFDACWERWVRPIEWARHAESVPPTGSVPEPNPSRWLIAVIAGIAIGVAGYLILRAWPDGGPVAPSSDVAIVNILPIDADADLETPPIDAGKQSPLDAGAAPNVPPIDAGEELPLDASTTYPPPKRTPPPSQTGIDVALVGLMFGVIMLLSAAITGAIRAYARRRFLPGPWRYALAVPPATKPVLPRSAIEDAAADLTWEAPDTGDELDVARSVVATVARGGLPTFVYRRPVAVPRYLVLEDTAGGAERWRFVYDELLHGLTREGIEIERYTFAANLEQCTGLDGRPVALGDLLDHADALIAIGDGDAAVDALSGDRADWLVTLHYVPRRLWINPFPLARWSVGAHAIAADTPMEHGVARALAAMRVGVDRQAHPNSAYPAVIERTPGTASAIVALRAALGNRAFRLVAAMSVVGPPTVSLARWLAEFHTLELDEQDWLCVVTLPWFRTEQWPIEACDRLSDALGSDSPDLVRALAVSSDRLLAASEPLRDSAAYLAWQLDAAHRAGRRGERGVAARALNQISGTPLAAQASRVRTALGLRDRSRIALISAIVVGAALIAGAAGYSIVETHLHSAARERRVAERHLEKLAGEGVQLPAPTGPRWPEVFVVRVLDGDGNPVPNSRVVWSDPQLGPRSYIGTTDANGLSRATQVYSSSPRDDLEQVAQLITTWNDETFTDKPVSTNGERVAFHFTQIGEVSSVDAGTGSDPAAAASESQAESIPSDAALGMDASVSANDPAKQIVVCNKLLARRAWQELEDCATALETLGDRDKAQKFYIEAKREIRNAAKAMEAQQAIRDGNLRVAQASLRGIDDSSVYLVTARDTFTKAESREVETVIRFVRQFANNQECSSLELYIAQLARSSSERVVAAARGVICLGNTPPAREQNSVELSSPCGATSVDELVAQAAVQYNDGFSDTALMVMIKALGCKQGIHMYQLAALYACGARNLPMAQLYFAEIPTPQQSGIEQRCQQEGLDVRGP